MASISSRPARSIVPAVGSQRQRPLAGVHGPGGRPGSPRGLTLEPSYNNADPIKPLEPATATRTGASLDAAIWRRLRVAAPGLTTLAMMANVVSQIDSTQEVTVTDQSAAYRKPGAVTRRMMNPFLVLAMRMGISVWGSRVREVKGRTTGSPRRTPVNLLTLDGHEYLVSPRGDTQWARNVRADNGRLVLELGRHREERTARELPDEEKPPVLRAYLKGGRWRSECSSMG